MSNSVFRGGINVDGVFLLRWLEAAIPPLAFMLITWSLLEPKYPNPAHLWVLAFFLGAEAAVQAAVFTLSQSPEQVFTLLPLTFYLPAIVCLHLISKHGFIPTALSWLFGLLCVQLLLSLQKLLTFLDAGLSEAHGWLLWVNLLLAAGLLLLLVHRLLRRPFLACAPELEGSWLTLLFLPVMLLCLYSYFLSGTTNVTVLILLFFTSLAAFLVISRLIASLGSEQRARDTRLQMKVLSRDYELLQKKLELGRGYRHDMRHHITALSAMLQEGDCGAAQRYVADLQGRLTRIESVAWCRNTAVNGVISSYAAQAKEIGCDMEVEVSLPGEFPFEEVDLCVVLANALENAVHACEALPRDVPGRIKLSLTLTDLRRLTVCVENTCPEKLEFDSEGFPIVPRRSGHGQGLHSIAAVAEKYRGLFNCECADGTFTLRVVLLDASPETRRASRAPAVLAGIFLCLFFINCTPALAQAVEDVPVLGPIVRAVDLRTYSLSWGDTGITVQDPVLEGSGPAADKIEAEKDEFIRRMEENFIWYASRKYQGYVAGDISYDVVRDDDELFTLRFYATLNAGGSVDYSRCITLDRKTGQVLELSGLFQPEANYIFPISREIKAQMSEQINAGEADYFLPGGIWSDEECFQSIEPDQNFYINKNGQLVIVFAEYEVAPGSMGSPEFVIPTDVLDGLLVQPSVLS